MWIDPTNGQRMLVGADQGANVTLDGGKSWSMWYNQPVAQVYHVSTDTRYPYWVLAAQQDTGAVMTRSRGDYGQINITDWLPLPSSEFGTLTRGSDCIRRSSTASGTARAAAAAVWSRSISATGQWQNVAPNFGADSTKYRQSRDFWKRFDTAFDPRAMYVGYQCLLVTRDGAQTWSAFSPDLTTPKGEPMVACGTPPPAPAAPAAAAGAAGARGAAPAGATAGARGVAPAAPAAGGRGAGAHRSPISRSRPCRKGVVWTVSSNGQIYNTMDAGKHWNNVSNITDGPANVTFNTIEAGHHDVGTAYLAGRAGRGGGPGGAGGGGGSPGGGGGAAPVNTNAPLIWRTHDAGKTWTKIVNGLPSDERTGSWVNVVREDPKQKGLLVRRDGNDRLRVVRRWRPLAVAAAEPAEHVHPRHGLPHRRPHERSGDWDLRPRLLGARRHESTARHRRQGADDRRGAGLSLQAGRRDSRAHQRQLGSADRRRSAARAQPAVRRDHLLLSQPSSRRRDDAAGPRRRRPSGPHDLEHAAAADPGRAVPRLLAGDAGEPLAGDERGHEPDQLGPAL